MKPWKRHWVIRRIIPLPAIVMLLAHAALGESPRYERDVKPLLQARCFACHGALKQEAGLRLDTVAAMLEGGGSGPAVVQGMPAESLLLERVSAQDVDLRMPPAGEGEPLSEKQVAAVRDWIAAGAPAPADERPEADPREHWAFQPIVRPEVPAVRRGEWVRNPIDAFVARQHEARGLTPLPEASRAILLRRLSLDLIGLPPTPEEIAAVQDDPGTDWYERVVDRLLDDPRHGERWARHWMDIWRYSDWWGLGDQLRNSQKHIWHWRDWIIESLNDDLPYDQMLRLMLAGDEIAPQDLSQLRATGYLARNYFLFNRTQWMDETVEHVGKAFLGLTTNCAKCHDHKYDPISQTDYYRLRAVFEPYHVRLDVVPGEPDLARDGIPRVFDGVLDAPTWRLIRGNDKNPDKSQPIEPGLPEVLSFAPLEVEPVKLPVTAWQPGRRPWVAEAYEQAAREQIEAAEAKVKMAAEKLALAEREQAAATAKQGDGNNGNAGDSEPKQGSDDESRQQDGNPEAGGHGTGDPRTGGAEASEVISPRNGEPPSAVARQECQVAELALAVAKAELHSVRQRAAATQNGGEDDDKKLARAAARAERETAAARARLALSEAELRLLQAEGDKRDEAAKQVAAAREKLDEATRQVEQPSDQFTPLVGARWTPTRFQFSGKDDPAIPFPPTSTGRRKALAEWITDRRNPLTARVAVNHMWTRHFGAPLVPTVFDFGRNGQPPTHPELLDWLASELIDSGWSMKHVHRLIVESSTYRLSGSSRGTEANGVQDPDNSWLWRRTPGRLESQAVRDSLLALAGTLDPALGGPPVPKSQQDGSKRRSLYFFHSNNERNLFLTMFDEALVTECYRRDQSIVPQQALALTNSQLVLDVSPRIAQRITRNLQATGQPGDDDAFVRAAFILLLAVEPTDSERAASLRSLDAWRKLPEAGQADAATAFARANLVWVLLNHNDFITIR